MKKILPMLVLSSLVASSLAIVGCAAFSGHTPPTKFETVMFTHQTNVVTQVVEVPKEVWKTNTVTKVVTNEHNVRITNVVEQYVPTVELVSVTNRITNYTTLPRPEVEADIGAIGGAANLILPGLGVPLAGALLGLYRFWAKLRSSKEANKVMATNVASLLEFLETLPKGTEQVEILKAWLRKNQEKVGAHAEIAQILAKYVEHKQVKDGTLELKNLLQELVKVSQ